MENVAHEIVMVLDDFEQAETMVTGLESKFPDDKETSHHVAYSGCLHTTWPRGPFF